MDQKWGARLFAVTPTEETAKALFLDLKDVENLKILYYPSNGKMLYSSSISSIDNDAKKALLEMDGMRTGIIVTSLRAFISPVLSRAMMDEMTLSIALHDEHSNCAKLWRISSNFPNKCIGATQSCLLPTFLIGHPENYNII